MTDRVLGSMAAAMEQAYREAWKAEDEADEAFWEATLERNRTSAALEAT